MSYKQCYLNLPIHVLIIHVSYNYVAMCINVLFNFGINWKFMKMNFGSSVMHKESMFLYTKSRFSTMFYCSYNMASQQERKLKVT